MEIREQGDRERAMAWRVPLTSEERGLNWLETMTPQAVAGVAFLFLVPVLHPLLLPVVGVPSHLLWFEHVLPVAWMTFQGGRRSGSIALLVSALLVGVGEATFGAGYGQPADSATVVALLVAVSLTNVLVAVFALYARRVSRRYRLLFDRNAMGALQLDSDGRVTRINTVAAELLAVREPKAWLGQPVEGLIEGVGLESLREVERHGGWTGELLVNNPAEPDRRQARHVLLAWVSDPRSGRAQLFLADRSVEVMQEREIERRVRLSALGEALAGVAHELNNPLMSIMAHTHLAGSPDLNPDELPEFLEVIDGQARRMKGLIGELVGFARPAAETEETPIDDLVGKIVRVQQITLGARVRLTAELSAGGSVPVEASKIEQVLLNLISNAAYAVRQGGQEVRVVTSADDDHVHVEVQDDGDGIPPEIYDHLFEAFATTKPEGEGTGLGLAISRRLARSWGGDLTARNREEGGAAFRLSIPRVTPETAYAADPAEARSDADRVVEPARY